MYTKYPSTPHLPWSRPTSPDDKKSWSTDQFVGQRVIVTEKMDGENTTMYCDHIHARSIDSRHHVSRDWVKRLWGRIAHRIPEGWKVCGENVYAKHSIYYDNLPSYFLAFSVWNGDMCLSWDDTLRWCDILGIEHVPVLYDGPYVEKDIRSLYSERNDQMEGYVVRIADAFPRYAFPKCVQKFVRENHVQTDQHWMKQEIVPNKLAV